MGTNKNAKEKEFSWTVNENSRKPEEPVAISVGLEVSIEPRWCNQVYVVICLAEYPEIFETLELIEFFLYWLCIQMHTTVSKYTASFVDGGHSQRESC